MPNVDQIIRDPEFYQLPAAERQKVLLRVDPDFRRLPAAEQMKAVQGLSEKFGNQPPLMASHGNEMQPPQEVPAWKKAVSHTARSVLPTVGGVAGGIIGGGGALIGGQLGPQIALPEEVVTVPAAATAGGAVGYGIGEQAADVLDQFLGLSKGQSLPEAAKSAAGNVYEGAKAEALGLGMVGAGQAVGKVAAPVYRSLRDFLANLTASGADKTAEKELAKILSQFERSGDSALLQQAEALASRVPGLKYTRGMGANNPDLISLERGAIAGSTRPGLEGSQTQADELLQGNVAAVEKKLKTIGGKAEDFTAELGKQRTAMETERAVPIDRQATGESLLGKINEAKTPVKAQMREMEAAIPDYPVSPDATRSEIAAILQQKELSKDQRQAVKTVARDIAQIFEESGQSTKALMGARRTVNDAIDRAQGTSSIAPLMRIKAALDQDVSTVAGMARTGRLKEYQGKPIFPDKLAAELEDNALRIAELRAGQDVDVPTMIAWLRERRVPSAKVVNETDSGFAKRIMDTYERMSGQKPPMKGLPGAGDTIKRLEGRNQEIAKILQEVEPGQDVAALMNAYNRYASEEYFGRFGTDAVKRAEMGNLAKENVSARFATDTGVDELVKAIGRQDAKEAMWAHYRADLSDLLTRNPSDQQLNQWLVSNRRQLGKLGLYDDFQKAVRRQIGYRQVEKITKADIESVFSAVLAGNAKSQRAALDPILTRVKHNAKAMEGLKGAFIDHLTAKLIQPITGGKSGFGQAAKTLRDIEPTVQRLFTPAEQKTLADVRRAIELTQRLTKGTPIGGSQTQELMKAVEVLAGQEKRDGALAYILLTSLGAGAGAAVSGPLGAAGGASLGGAVKAMRDVAKLHGEEALRRYFVRATFDPEYAATLKTLSRGATPAIKTKISDQVGRMAGYAMTQAVPQGQ